MKDFGRPYGSGPWGPSVLTSYRISKICKRFLDDMGKEHGTTREYLERLVPESYRLELEEQTKQQIPSVEFKRHLPKKVKKISRVRTTFNQTEEG